MTKNALRVMSLLGPRPRVPNGYKQARGADWIQKLFQNSIFQKLREEDFTTRVGTLEERERDKNTKGFIFFFSFLFFSSFYALFFIVNSILRFSILLHHTYLHKKKLFQSLSLSLYLFLFQFLADRALCLYSSYGVVAEGHSTY